MMIRIVKILSEQRERANIIHFTFDATMKQRAFVMQWFATLAHAFLASAQCTKVFSRTYFEQTIYIHILEKKTLLLCAK